jgi:hypothetical protein
MSGLSGVLTEGPGNEAAKCGKKGTFDSTAYNFKKPVDAKKVPQLWITP